VYTIFMYCFAVYNSSPKFLQVFQVHPTYRVKLSALVMAINFSRAGFQWSGTGILSGTSWKKICWSLDWFMLIQGNSKTIIHFTYVLRNN
jgi:hypothetical protein